MLPYFSVIFLREIDGLARQVAAYPDDESLWKELPGCPNSGGNLALHLVGNLRHFIGAQLGHTGYVRNRDAEFSTRGVSRHELGEMIAAARADVAATFEALDPSVLEGSTSIPGNRSTSTGLWLTHLCSHLGYHLGQIDYHRRAVSANAAGAGMLPVEPLIG